MNSLHPGIGEVSLVGVSVTCIPASCAAAVIVTPAGSDNAPASATIPTRAPIRLVLIGVTPSNPPLHDATTTAIRKSDGGDVGRSLASHNVRYVNLATAATPLF
ncbi:MAG TPA: hypothetical protein VG318_10210 [Actinomycetota bacterium]|nr:hypothetical protein [Actinomycetota bacterium]